MSLSTLHHTVTVTHNGSGSHVAAARSIVVASDELVPDAALRPAVLAAHARREVAVADAVVRVAARRLAEERAEIDGDDDDGDDDSNRRDDVGRASEAASTSRVRRRPVTRYHCTRQRQRQRRRNTVERDGRAVASIARDDRSTLPGDDHFPRARNAR